MLLPGIVRKTSRLVSMRKTNAAYYAMAPGIVTAINQLTNAAEIWNTINEELVEPCVQMIHTHQYEDAYHLYKTYSLKLSKLYLGSKK